MKKSRIISRITYIAFFLLFLITPLFLQISFAAPQVEVSVDSTKSNGTNKFSIGFQLDGHDIKIWRDRSALRELAQEANFKLIRFFEHRLGKPCTNWNEGTKTGQWDWRELDLLMQRIFEIGAEPLIALGFVGYETRRLTSVPNGMSYNPTTGLPDPDQWAAYCAEWVRHFKEAGFPVRYYEMINEAYHYFDWPATQPKLRYFMDLYNAAAKAMRNVNPNVKIGNDACVLKSVLDYFITNGENLDFLSYHAYGTSSLSATDSEIFQAAETKYIEESRTVYGVEKTRQLYKNSRGIDLPVIHAENNLNYHFTQGTDPRIQKMQGAVYHALTFRTSILNGYFHNSYFHFASSQSSQQRNPSGGLGFGMVNSDNNLPWYPYYAHQIVGNNLAIGDTLIDTNSNSEDIRTVAWIHQNKLNLLLICKVDQERTVHLNGLSGYVDYYKIDNTISWQTPRIQSGRISANNPLTINGYTVMLLQSEISTTPTPPTPPTPPPPTPTTSSSNDDFESQNFNKWTGTLTSSGESVTIVNYMPYQGNYHGRFSSNGGQSTENAYSYMQVDEEELFVRGYFYVPTGLPLSDNNDRFYFLRFKSGSQSLAGAGIRRNGNVDQWILYARDGTSWVGPYYESSPSIQTDRWYSIEMHWKKDSSSGLAELYVNGIKTIEARNINTANFGNIDEIDFGIVSATSIQSDLIVYGDSFALSNTYIGTNLEDPDPPEDDPIPQEDDLIFKDNFESGTFNSWSSTSRSSGETTNVAGSSAYTGTYGGQFTTNGNGAYEKAYAYENLIPTLDEVNVQSYFRMVQSGIVENSDRIKLIELRAGSAIIASAGLWQRAGNTYWWMETRNSANYLETYTSPVTIDIFEWFSLELRWVNAATNGGSSLWINGAIIYEINNLDTNNYGNCSQVKVGIAEAYNCMTTTVYADEVKIADSYISPY